MTERIYQDVGNHVADSIFKAYDIRGIVDETLTNDTVYAIGRAFGSEALAIGQRGVAVGRARDRGNPEVLGTTACRRPRPLVR